ncbi:4Fe-4S dicluster domain-containing protein [bacterium]|nr:4Fe-4S dicluster domain-containing protein [bacterium]
MNKPRFLVDETLCCGCLSCMINCAQVHAGVASPVESRIKVLLKPFEGTHRITYCHQCDPAECAENCPSGAIQHDETGTYYRVDYQLCIDCRTCVEVCPYGAMIVSPSLEKIIKCELCSGSEPVCVQSCFTGALWFGSIEDHPDPLTSRSFGRERGGKP